MAIDRGIIKGVDTRIYELLPEYKGTKWIDQRYDIKLKHVLTMTAGLDWKWELKATVRRRGDRLFIDLPKSAEIEVRPLDENEFLYSLKGFGDVRL